MNQTMTLVSPDFQLGDRLIAKKLITKDQLAICLKQQQNSARRLGEILLDFGYIVPLALLETLSEMTGHPYLDLTLKALDVDFVQQLPKEIALANKVLLMEACSQFLYVAMSDPEDVLVIDLIQRHLKTKLILKPFHADAKQIVEAINLYYPNEESSDYHEMETVRLVHHLLHQAVRVQASDIHLQPEDKQVTVRHRLDGVLTTVRLLHNDLWSSICVRLKIMAGLDIAESRRPQSGHFYLNIIGRHLDFRLSTHPTIYGENIVIRLLDQSRALQTLTQLGYAPEQQERLHELVQEPHGLVIVSGPTGAGKTTTLYSLLSAIDPHMRNVMTLEDPVEYELPNIRQTDLRHQDVLSFAQGVRSLLRQDPDVIFISEIRDAETAQMAIRAAMTGHLVLSTLHANDNAHVPARLIDLGVSPQLLAGNLNACLTQRLLRRLCWVCQARSSNCAECEGRGYRGRVAIADLLVIDEELAQILSKGGDWFALQAALKARHHPGLWDAGEKVVAQGMTTRAELMRVLGRPVS